MRAFGTFRTGRTDNISCHIRNLWSQSITHMSALNILLVDDDRNLARTLSAGLRKVMGETISAAICSNGSQALSIMKNQRFDVVISDFNMPGMSGLEFFDTVRQTDRETILVLITAHGTQALGEQAQRLGFGYLTKPFEPSRLVHIIHNLIRGRESNDETENAPRILHTNGNVLNNSNLRAN